MATPSGTETTPSINYEVELENILAERQVRLNLLNMGEIIHQGLTCNVYRGIYNSKEVAIKEIVQQNTSNAAADNKVNAERNRRLEREIVLLCNARHEFVVKFIAASQDPAMIILEFMPHGTLENYLSTSQLDLRRSIHYAWRISRAMLFLHKSGITLRNLNPSNIFLIDDNHIKLANFGDAVRKGEKKENTFSGDLRWAAPEMFKSMLNMDPTIDVYSFSLVLFSLLTHETPFKKITGDSALLEAYEKNARPECDNVPDSYVSLLTSCWKKDPKKRPDFTKISTNLKIILDSIDDSCRCSSCCS